MIQIVSKKDGFRRGGVAHPDKPKDYPDDFFSKDQLEAMENEPMLFVTHLPDLPKKDLEEETRARKMLEGMTNDKLKADCDAEGIKYAGNATKAELVDLLLKNTAPAPEE